ncbi:hypothetical protein [Oceanibaculum nanhaiense]|uniref:hypothetical protein n=1 Tax=Oceanibaculum nanhaiense TaxID=1909734 RepID=UPI003D2AF548
MSVLLGNPLLLAVRRIFIGDVFDITLDSAASLDGVSTTGWDLLIAKSRGQTTSWLWRDTVRGLSTALRSDDPSTPIAFSRLLHPAGGGECRALSV